MKTYLTGGAIAIVVCDAALNSFGLWTNKNINNYYNLTLKKIGLLHFFRILSHFCYISFSNKKLTTFQNMPHSSQVLLLNTMASVTSDKYVTAIPHCYHMRQRCSQFVYFVILHLQGLALLLSFISNSQVHHVSATVLKTEVTESALDTSALGNFDSILMTLLNELRLTLNN